MPFTYLNNWNYNKKTTIRNDYLNNVIFVKRMENKLALVSRFFSEHNKPPVAKVGKDVTIFLPRDTVILNGTNSTDDQKISSYKWNQVR